MTLPPASSKVGQPWTVDDLLEMPDDGYRRELFDGMLIVTPPAARPHVVTSVLLRRLLDRAMPDWLTAVTDNVGVYFSDNEFLVPDLIVINEDSLGGRGRGFRPDEVILAVEIVSPGNPRNDYVFKNKIYAMHGIGHYWIVDEKDKSLHVMKLGADQSYVELFVAQPGRPWVGKEPFPLTLDPADIFRS